MIQTEERVICLVYARDAGTMSSTACTCGCSMSTFHDARNVVYSVGQRQSSCQHSPQVSVEERTETMSKATWQMVEANGLHNKETPLAAPATSRVFTEDPSTACTLKFSWVESPSSPPLSVSLHHSKKLRQRKSTADKPCI